MNRLKHFYVWGDFHFSFFHLHDFFLSSPKWSPIIFDWLSVKKTMKNLSEPRMEISSEHNDKTTSPILSNL